MWTLNSVAVNAANIVVQPRREALMDWYCVYIDERRPTHPLNSAFRKMIINEYRDIGEPRDCHVYLRADPDGALSYFFSPGAAKTLEAFVKFWGGVGCPAPTNLHQMEKVI